MAGLLIIRGGKLYQQYTNYLNIIFGETVYILLIKWVLITRMTLFNDAEYRHTIFLKLENRFITCLTILGPEAKATWLTSMEIKSHP